MNFRITEWKVIISLIIALVLNFLLFMNLNGGCRGIYCYFPSSISYKFLWIFVLLIVYIIWSLIENKKRKRGK